jgi:hypothetical protein
MQVQGEKTNSRLSIVASYALFSREQLSTDAKAASILIRQ